MTSEPTIDLPKRVVVGTNGAYWRDYGDHYSMCPVSDDNEPVEFAAVYSRSRPGDGVYVSQEWLDERMADSMRERAELAAEKERVARLREALERAAVNNHEQGDHEGYAGPPTFRVCADPECSNAERVLAETADAAPAEPRWPSGPEAEQELAAALHEAAGTHSMPKFTRQICPGPHLHAKEVAAILTALQEKRDPGE